MSSQTVQHRKYLSFLQTDKREPLVRALTDAEVPWSRSEELGSSGRGATYQLSDEAARGESDITRLGVALAASIYDRVRHDFTLPEPAELTAQIFPVMMIGSKESPPHQLPHVDGAYGNTPTLTTVYYVACTEVDGGDLVIQADSPYRVHPEANLLLAFSGSLHHEVLPLVNGTRISVVCNLYAGSHDLPNQ